MEEHESMHRMYSQGDQVLTSPRTIGERFDVPEDVHALLVKLAERHYPATTIASWYQSVLDEVGVGSAINTYETNNTPTTSTTPTKYFCTACPKGYRQSKDCKRHAKGHWIRYDCKFPGCSAAFFRPDHFLRHHRANNGHTCTMKHCLHLSEAAVITSAWVALGCGFCEKLFVSEIINGTADINAMDKTHNDYMNHVIKHYNEGKVANDWSKEQQIKSLLCQPYIKVLWEQICAQAMMLPSDLRWSESIPEEFIRMLECGQVSFETDATVNLTTLFHEALGHGDLNAVTQPTVLASPSVDLHFSDAPWYAAMVTGFGYDESSVSSSKDHPTTATSATVSSFAPLDTTLFEYGSMQTTEVSPTTFVETQSDGLAPAYGTKHADVSRASPANSFDWPENSVSGGIDLVGNQPFTENWIPNTEAYDQYSYAPTNHDLTQTLDLTALQEPESEAFAHESLVGFDQAFPALQPSQTKSFAITPAQYNTTPPISEHELKKGHKRPLSGIQHLRRISRNIFHR